jgi:hypothetical protein
MPGTKRKMRIERRRQMQERGRQTRLIHVSTGTRSLSLRFPLMSMRMAKLVRWVQEQVLKDTECSNSLDTNKAQLPTMLL